MNGKGNQITRRWRAVKGGHYDDPASTNEMHQWLGLADDGGLFDATQA